MKKHTTIAMDIAKSVYEVAVSEEPGRVKERRRLSRSQMLRFFANREPARVVIEACGSAHALARTLEGYGHEMVLLPPGQVRRYVLRDKTDRTDTKGLLEADRNEEIVPVPVKTVGQQVLVSVHRMRSGWMATRTARLNAIRGLLRELGSRCRWVLRRFCRPWPKRRLPASCREYSKGYCRRWRRRSGISKLGWRRRNGH